MRQLLVLTSILLASSLAHADTISAQAPAYHDPSSRYLSLGASLGGGTDAVRGGFNLEGGYQLAPTLWLHGEIGGGDASDAIIFADKNGAFVQVRAGIENHACMATYACVITGLDVGVRDYALRDENGVMSNTIDTVVIPRVQLDLGGAVRVRPGIELDVGGGGVDGGDVTLAVAYQW